MIQVKILGQRSLRGKLLKLRREQRSGLKEGVAHSLAEVEEEARRNLWDGSAPHDGTGDLAKSIAIRLDSDGLGGSVGTDLAYGRFLEFGTRHMTARPWLQPAFDAVKPRIRRRLRDAVKEANRKAGRTTGSSGA